MQRMQQMQAPQGLPPGQAPPGVQMPQGPPPEMSPMGPMQQPDPMQMQRIMQMRAQQEQQMDPRARMMAYRQAMMGQQGF
jgi:hypothetical protein